MTTNLVADSLSVLELLSSYCDTGSTRPTWLHITAVLRDEWAEPRVEVALA